MLFDSVAFKAVVSNGLVLDKDGNKMSKRLGNAVDPFETIDEKGSDPLRWYMITNASPWDNIRFDPAGIDEVQRKYFGTLYNTYSFFALYANIDHFDPEAASIPYEERSELDRWIISKLNSLTAQVTEWMDDFEPTRAARAISDFLNDQLSNWYVRLSRKRFWGGGMGQDKLAAYQTLYECLETIARLTAPFAPFYSDLLYRDLVGSDKSVHLADFPKADKAQIFPKLEIAMDYAQRVSSMVLALRRRMDVKVRQPLQKILVLTSDEEATEAISHVKDMILSEVNVKELIFADDDSGVVVKRIKPNYRALGPVFGKEMKQVATFLDGLSQKEISAFERNGQMECLGKNITTDQVEIISEDVPGWLVQNEGVITVALDANITPELHDEGLARELVNRIQNLRKAKNFDVADKIKVEITEHPQLHTAITQHQEYISTQVQALELQIVSHLEQGEELSLEEGLDVKIKIEKI